jgi:peptidoglycan hydrolase-like protein with peptidoglycan-binding domain
LYGGRRAQIAADPLRTKRFFLAGVAVGIIAMSATGLAAARLIESPSQLAARSAAPAPSVITGVARMLVLRNSIVLPGTVRAGNTVAVTASAPYHAIVVTKMPVELGRRVRPGQVIAEIDGRPVLLLRGQLPAYRDLREGDTGPDVGQLQAALTGLGYSDFDPAGYFGPGTALALQLLYQHLGYPAPLYRPPASKSRRSARTARPAQPYLPMGEVSYISAASALVVAVTAKTGTTVTAGQVILRLATGHPYVTAMLSARQAALVRTGGAAQIASDAPPLTDAGVISKISVTPAYAAPGAGQAGYPVSVTTRRPLPQDLIGTTVGLTLWSAVTNGPVLTVPLAAIFAGRHGGPACVVLVAGNGRRHRVAVVTGPMAAGFVTVQPVIQPAGTGTLQPGDHVLIGMGR